MEMIFEKIICNIKKNKKNTSIIVVGSNKNIDSLDVKKDVDLFVIDKDSKKQIRKIENLDGIDFDINYFSKALCEELIIKKEYFFLKGLHEGNLIYDVDGYGENIMTKAKLLYEQGPCYVDKQDLDVFKINIYDSILSLQKTQEICQFTFLMNTILKDILKYYFYKNNIWLPKDKKIILYMKNHEKEIFTYINKLYKDNDINMLKKIIECI